MQEESHNTPRWVKAFGIVTLILAVLIVVAMFTGGGRHGPGRHMPANNEGETLSYVPRDALPGGRLDDHIATKDGY